MPCSSWTNACCWPTVTMQSLKMAVQMQQQQYQLPMEMEMGLGMQMKVAEVFRRHVAFFARVKCTAWPYGIPAPMTPWSDPFDPTICAVVGPNRPISTLPAQVTPSAQWSSRMPRSGVCISVVGVSKDPTWRDSSICPLFSWPSRFCCQLNGSLCSTYAYQRNSIKFCCRGYQWKSVMKTKINLIKLYLFIYIYIIIF